MKAPLKLSLAVLALASLGACGITGDLERPDPLWGKPDAQTKPAELPETSSDTRPPLPPRATDSPAAPAATDTPPNSDDELLGGPEG